MNTSVLKRIFKPLAMAMLALALFGSASAQTNPPIRIYSSGSTGADGAFNPKLVGEDLTGVPPGTTYAWSGEVLMVILPLPANGILNFTTFMVPTNVYVTFKRNELNTPAIVLASGDVFVHGEIAVSSGGIQAAPGGFDGQPRNVPGNGPGAGTLNVNRGSRADYSPGLPLFGGNGSGAHSPSGIQSAAGGGVLYLASSGKISFSTPPGSKVASLTAWGAELGNGFRAMNGSIALFANQIEGPINSHGMDKFLLFAAKFTHTITGAKSPNLIANLPTLLGIPGIHLRPVAYFKSIGGVAVPDGYTSETITALSVATNIAIRVETKDLPPGLVFDVDIFRERTANSGEYDKLKTVTTPPTTGDETLAAAVVRTDFGSGIHFLTGKAKSAVNIASAPRLSPNDPIEEMLVALDSNGQSILQFQTKSGVILSAESAFRLANQQNKQEFLAKYEGHKLFGASTRPL